MKLLLNRRYKGSEYTIGSLSIDGEYFCDTLEDTDRGLSSTMSYKEITDKKVYGKTAIPTGVYNVSMNIVSSKFKNRKWAARYNGKIPRLLNVIGFDGILIHPGNTSDDTYGCILVGENKVKGMVINSQSTFKRLYQRLLEASSLTIEII